MFDLAVFKVLRDVIFKELVAFQRFSIKKNFQWAFSEATFFMFPADYMVAAPLILGGT